MNLYMDYMTVCREGHRCFERLAITSGNPFDVRVRCRECGLPASVHELPPAEPDAMEDPRKSPLQARRDYVRERDRTDAMEDPS